MEAERFEMGKKGSTGGARGGALGVWRFGAALDPRYSIPRPESGEVEVPQHLDSCWSKDTRRVFR